jgi:hypothetical protein
MEGDPDAPARHLRPGAAARGPQPALSDSEVLTIECVGEFLGIDTDKGLYRTRELRTLPLRTLRQEARPGPQARDRREAEEWKREPDRKR